MLHPTFLELALNSGHILEVALLKIVQTLPSPDTQALVLITFVHPVHFFYCLTILCWNTFKWFCLFLHALYSSLSNAMSLRAV